VFFVPVFLFQTWMVDWIVPVNFRQLLRDPEVLFAGYRVPHPLKHQIDIKVQTTEESAPVTAVSSALEDLKVEVQSLQEAFRVRFRKQKSRARS
jgi:DNA-directed RNA polymerase II subunit RPB11